MPIIMLHLKPPPPLWLLMLQSMEADLHAMEGDLHAMGRKLLRSDKRASELQMELARSEASRWGWLER